MTVGQTTLAGMVKRYRRAGFRTSSEYVSTFGGRFVSVEPHTSSRTLISAFGTGRRVTTLAIPVVPVCE